MIKKRLPAAVLALLILLWLFTGCGQGEKVETSWTTAQMAEALFVLQDESNFQRTASGDSAFSDYLTNYYHLNPENVADGTILFAGGTSALEIAVLQMSSADMAGETLEALQTYIQERTGAFTGYLPDEAAILEQSTAVSRGPYVALLICEEQQAAQETFTRCFEGTEPPAASPLKRPDSITPQLSLPASATPAPDEEVPTAPEGETDVETGPGTEEGPEPTQDDGEKPASEAPDDEPAAVHEPAPSVPETPPETNAANPKTETPWSYDSSRLLAAWTAGDWSSLHSRDREILDVCGNVMQTVIRPEMSDYDKELAIHDWMIDWASYDSDTLDHQQNAQPNPDHDNPYGFLIGKKGICLGYTSTFQLFMDMVGIECITVHGTAYSKTEEHAWNMVKLGGEWYCVDVTWDDPITHMPVSKMTAHLYFNVTSEFLRKRDHQWDESSVSEATATTYAWNSYA